MLPMFPLNSVLLPRQVLMLQVFEPRYLEMMSGCLEGDRRFGVVLIERGSEVGGGDVRTDVGVVAEIVSHQELDGGVAGGGSGGGRLGVLAVGHSRLRVSRWLTDDPFPRAEVELWPCEPDGAAGGAAVSDDELAQKFDEVTETVRRVWGLRREMGAQDPEVPDLFPLDSQGSFMLANQIPLQQYDRQRLLEAPGVMRRLDLLGELLLENEQLLLAQI